MSAAPAAAGNSSRQTASDSFLNVIGIPGRIVDVSGWIVRANGLRGQRLQRRAPST
jgi:hypothetical protein